MKARTPYKTTQRRHSRNVKSSSKKGRVQSASTTSSFMKEGEHPLQNLMAAQTRKGAIVLVKAKLKKGAKYK